MRVRSICLAPLLLIIVVSAAMGCRTIRRTVNSRPTTEARRLSREGLAAMHQDRWIEAEQLFESALELSRNDDRAFWGYSEVLWQKGLRDSAIEHLERAVSLSAGAPELRIRLGSMYLQQDRIDEAGEQAAKVIASNRDDAAAWALQGDVLFRKSEMESALASYHRAVALDQQCPKVRLGIADIYRRQERHDRLLSTLDRLPEERLPIEDASHVAMLRGIAMRDLGQPECGAGHLRRAIGMGLSDPEVFHELAQAEFASGRFGEASEAIASALQKSPSNQASMQLAELIGRAQARLAAESSSSATQER